MAELRGPHRWLLGTWAASVAWLLTVFDARWIPHDEGTLGQTAWRILLGEVPHRDFDAVYTGLLGYLHAAAMLVGGQDLFTMRVVLLAAALLWVPAVWAVAARLAGPVAASAATLLAVAAGPAIYPVGMPSWYNLFLATWGLLALVLWDESGRRRWLVVAGACAGVSVLFKVAGLYFLAAALFFVLHAEAARREAPAERPASRGPAGAMAATALLLALVALELALVRSQAAFRVWFHYVAPTGAAAIVAAAAVWRRPWPGGSATRRTAAGWIWLGAGFVVPVALFVGAFAMAGAADDLIRGVFVLPRLRFASAASLPLPLAWTAGAVVPLALIVAEPRVSRGRRGGLAMATGVGGLVLLALMGRDPVYRAVWHSMQPLVPVAALGAGVALMRRPIGLRRNAPAEATLWAAALVSLVQFPFSGPIYFAQVAPMGVLAALAALGASEGELRGPRPVALTLAAFYLAFLALGPDRGGHFAPPPDVPLAPLAFERGGIRVPAPEALEYARVVELLRTHSRGDAVYATPDAPEIYFLTGLRNPTRTLFEVFDDPGERSRRVLDALEAEGVDAVALNTLRRFSEPDMGVIREVERRYPRAERVGRFIVRWRDVAPDGGG